MKRTIIGTMLLTTIAGASIMLVTNVRAANPKPTRSIVSTPNAAIEPNLDSWTWNHAIEILPDHSRPTPPRFGTRSPHAWTSGNCMPKPTSCSCIAAN